MKDSQYDFCEAYYEDYPFTFDRRWKALQANLEPNEQLIAMRYNAERHYWAEFARVGHGLPDGYEQ